MKPARYAVGLIGFLLVWAVVAVVVGIVMAMIFPPTGSSFSFAGIGLDWRNLPGTILGFLAGLQSFRSSIRENGGKKSVQKPPPIPMSGQ